MMIRAKYFIAAAALTASVLCAPPAQAVSDEQARPAFGQPLHLRSGAFSGKDQEQAFFLDLRDDRYELKKTLMPYLRQRSERLLSAQPPTTPAFALDVEHWSQEKVDAAFYSRFQLAELSKHLLMLRQATHQISQDAIARLKAQGAPETLLRALARVQDIPWKNEEELLKWLSEDVGRQEVEDYREAILTQAVTQRVMPPGEVGEITAGATAEYVRQSMEAWNQSAEIPRKIKESVFGEVKKAPAKPQPAVDEPDDLLYMVEKIIKKWGLPRPRTVFISAILLYLVVAFVSRKIRKT